ncbi:MULTISPECIES: UdgX family uracil-DNA binding protein [unclassified Rhizobium]|uniref:UdgX family uracil-DNA binding protein n=1 Tax=unclassified Rhizobium TaxID=2613769 RepID=UPI001A98B036|nr:MULTISPECIES: UdgX family uracil-DNA binding protein [unclassified Rhizobium]MBX5155950.1 UdgX family uracil-DNA binding protein [Rhizobium sp. NZLR8]MBX5164281.1 UdgX family uracil-DNA binding protein [Rhizobium sp. NZLR4b]MBX5184322.1 UdgX family uracil-DNA binding protein [Rhizobium sp. NZLR5]MBX5192811.1 UdgX family uracil-DNA binding protein [Rhizobium sp. NZLR3b]MBX5201832.1 UdgX family uracil-DNA binding protein [Rhizobium sp. NZLR1]
MNIAATVGPALALDVADADSIAELRHQAEGCTRCDLYRNATQIVFGEGPGKAEIVLVGEQPGDREDLTGKPFVGPAGQLLDHCLEEAGLDRQRCYVTNAVKHFKFTPRGKRRLHAKPNAGEIRRCAWWLGAELNILQPKLVVALGASAVYALLGPKVKLTPARGHILQPANHSPVLVTIHPSYLLRIRDEAERHRLRLEFVSDLHKAAEFGAR